LADHSGPVAVMDEPVIDPVSLLESLARRHRRRLFLYDPDRASWQLDGPGQVTGLRIGHPWDSLPGSSLQLVPRAVVLTAGAGNAKLREQLGLAATETQRRPLHMVLVRGETSDLPELFGHQVDAAHTRLTITSGVDSRGRTVWQLGGQVAEDGVTMTKEELVRHAAKELAEVLPGLDSGGLEVNTYRVDRAEAATQGGRRPETQSLRVDGNTLTAFPTKLALAPVLAREVAAAIGDPAAGVSRGVSTDLETLEWPRPEVAHPPWESATDWIPLALVAASRRAA
jgi:hypothetical protein